MVIIPPFAGKPKKIGGSFWVLIPSYLIKGKFIKPLEMYRFEAKVVRHAFTSKKPPLVGFTRVKEKSVQPRAEHHLSKKKKNKKNKI